MTAQVIPYPLPAGSDPNDQGEPRMVSFGGVPGHEQLFEEWLLEADMTAYRIFVAKVPSVTIPEAGVGASTMFPTRLVMSTIAGGGTTAGLFGDKARYPYQRWTVTGGGAWYPFLYGSEATLDYVAEKFRLNDVDAYHVWRLLRAALAT